MSERLLTLTTDFGEGSSYVAAMKGVLLSINPRLRIVDLSHRIPPQDLRQAALFLAETLPYYPAGSIHVIVVDPGVGTHRALLHVEITGSHLLAPDNGCWTLACSRLGSRPCVRRLTEPSWWRDPVSATFHGRDILAPVAARLSLGHPPEELGPLVESWRSWSPPEPTITAEKITGEVLIADPFGNLITNISATLLEKKIFQDAAISMENRLIPTRVRTYGDADPGTLIALLSSSGFLEIARVQGNAAAYLGLGVGARVEVVGRSKK